MLVNGCTTETVHIWPLVGKAKMRLRNGTLFQFSKNFFTIFTFLLTIFQKIYRLSNTFWLYQHRVKNAPIQFYSHLLMTIFNRNTLQFLCLDIQGPAICVAERFLDQKGTCHHNDFHSNNLAFCFFRCMHIVAGSSEALSDKQTATVLYEKRPKQILLDLHSSLLLQTSIQQVHRSLLLLYDTTLLFLALINPFPLIPWHQPMYLSQKCKRVKL